LIFLQRQVKWTLMMVQNNHMTFFIFILFVCLLRIGELLLSERDSKWLLEVGAVEHSRKHYPFLVALNVGFFISLISEYTQQQYHSLSLLLLIFFCLLLPFKIWIISSLGKSWNTRNHRFQGLESLKTGPYKFFKHPNYAVVIAEMAVIPLIFQLYFTAIVFTLHHKKNGNGYSKKRQVLYET
jgi:methyltransferase